MISFGVDFPLSFKGDGGPLFWIVFLIDFIIVGILYGTAVQKIIEDKGYRENWFIVAFFFRMIVLLIALSKDDLTRKSESTHLQELASEYEKESRYIVGKW